MNKVLVLLFWGLILCGCGSKKANEDEIEALLGQKEYIIVDVRSEEEFLESHIENAINIPYDEIDEDVLLDKNKNIFVYCKSGNRSGIAYQTLTNLGFNVYDLGAFDRINLPKVSK